MSTHMASDAPILIFLHRGEYETVHQGLAIASAAVAMKRRVELYFFWWALERLIRGNLDEPDLDRDDVAATMELRAVPTIRQLVDSVRNSKLATLFACTGSMAAVGLSPAEVEAKVDVLIGWVAILQRTAGNADRFQF